MNLCSPDCLCLLHPLCIVIWKHRCPCTELCVCPSHPASGPIPWLKCVHALIHVFMSTQLPMLAQPPMDSYMETWVLMCVIVCISVTLILVPHLGKNVYMHQSMYLCLPHSPCLLHPISIFTWKCGFLCVALCVCSSHFTYVPTPCLECVYASVHVCMSTWLPISPQTPMHSYMETWVCLDGTMFVSQSPHFCSHTLFRMCTCISTCTYVHLTPMLAKPPMDSYTETWVPVCGTVCVPVTLLVVPHPDWSMYMHQYMYTCSPNSLHLLHPPIRRGSSDQRWEL